ncbi:MAG: hypothetical protein FD189_2252 [Elusimicrobia bacterium]|nr:MAG: hypothetical protein FD154_2065 [Elusimicrobiota bacterium]KAF0153821.1 MAG: hypothetical protein FD189_2252 [Elusimicrobiota bacterium]
MDFNAEFNRTTVLDFLKTQFLSNDFALSQIVSVISLHFLRHGDESREGLGNVSA